MKNWLSSLLFGSSADEPAVPSTPLRSPEDIKIDAIRAKYCFYRRIPYSDPGFGDWRTSWRQKLKEGYRFVLITLPWMWRHDGSSEDVQHLVHPHSRDLPDSDAFDDYCHSLKFAELIGEEVGQWREEADVWNASCGPEQRYLEEYIACPKVIAVLLDDESDPPPRSEVIGRRFDRPPPSAPMPAKLIPPPPSPGIGQAIKPTNIKQRPRQL